MNHDDLPERWANRLQTYLADSTEIEPACQVRHMFEGAEVVRQGVFFYDGAVACDVRIVKHNWRYGSGDYEDPPEVRDDVEGEFFYIQYGSTTERGKYVAGSGAFPSVEEAVGHAERSLSGVSWIEKQ